ncbi:MAG: redoxin domain-containing protein [Anaerolineales bacterium]|nr:redoxin domain-containing protein [Anaerolineales bacterium]
MAQLRQNYDQFTTRDTEVIVVGPENIDAFKKYWEEENLPFIGLADPTHTVLKTYGQQIKLFKLGRMPAQAVINKQGIVRYIHYGHSMQDIPAIDEILTILDELNQ